MLMKIFIINLLGKSETDNSNVPCESAKIYIGKRIQGAHTDAVEFMQKLDEDDAAFDVEDGETETPFNLQEICSSETQIGAWLNETNEEVQELVSSSDNGDRDNILENKEFAKLFIRHCKMLPLFSAISNKFFDSPNPVGSSWSSETYFKNLKQVHGEEIPCSVDVFIKRDIELTNGSIVKASQNCFAIQTERLHYSTNITAIDEFDIEMTMELSTNAENPINSAIECTACKNGDAPGEAHQCIVCEKKVHLFDGCSVSIGEEEGYGERRKCIACHQIGKTTNSKTQILDAKDMNHEEKWNRSAKSKSNKYTKSVKNWNLIEMNKKVRIGYLVNENLLQTVYKIEDDQFKFSNTCDIDSPTQLTATAIAYHLPYRTSMTNENDGIFKIAKALAAKYVSK